VTPVDVSQAWHRGDSPTTGRQRELWTRRRTIRRSWCAVAAATLVTATCTACDVTTAPPTAPAAVATPYITETATPSTTTAVPAPVSTTAPSPPADPCHRGGVTYCVLNTGVTQQTIHQTICVAGWTATVRPPESYTEALKRQQIASEGLSGGLSNYEEDHRMPLELGGAPSDPLNLSPESPPSPNPKDSDETRLKHAVCDGALTLAQAQGQMVASWLAAYPGYRH
jgi:hypothetical protein